MVSQLARVVGPGSRVLKRLASPSRFYPIRTESGPDGSTRTALTRYTVGMLETMPRPTSDPSEAPIGQTFRLPPALMTYLRERAEFEDRSLNYIVVKHLWRAKECFETHTGKR